MRFFNTVRFLNPRQLFLVLCSLAFATALLRGNFATATVPDIPNVADVVAPQIEMADPPEARMLASQTVSPWHDRAIAQLPDDTDLDEVESPESESSTEGNKSLRILTKSLDPLVIEADSSYEGFCIDLLKEIANRLNFSYELEGTDTLAQLLDRVAKGTSDFAVGGISITAEREQFLDFSYPFFESGLQIMVLMLRVGT